MKWLQISCILILFAIYYMHAEESEANKDGDCYEQYLNQTDYANACVAEVLNETEFLTELSSTVEHYSGDNAAVHSFSDKYCPILRQALECTRNGYNVDKSCTFPYTPAEYEKRFEIPEVLLNYQCANRSAVFLRILENNGFDTINQNIQFKQCLRLMSNKPYLDRETQGTSPEVCDGLDKVFECYSNMVKNHLNQNLIEIAAEMHTIFRQTLQCNNIN